MFPNNFFEMFYLLKNDNISTQVNTTTSQHF